MQALVDRSSAVNEPSRRPFELNYEEPERAEVQVMALASIDKDEMQLLLAERAARAVVCTGLDGAAEGRGTDRSRPRSGSRPGGKLAGRRVGVKT